MKIPIRIAFLDSNNIPKTISLWYVESSGKIYCATKKTSKIVSFLMNNPQCGFEIAADNPPYKGVRGHGIVKIIDSRGSEILDILISKYLGHEQSSFTDFLRKNSHFETAIEISPQKLSKYDYSNRMNVI